MNTKHHFWMMVACMLPLLLIFLLPVFQIKNSAVFLIIIVVIFIGHLFMMGRHKGNSHNHDTKNQNNKEEDHEQHQH